MAPPPKTDCQPVARARSGDPAAWDALFRRYQLPLYTFVFEWLREEQASLDAVQETFIKASRHLHQLRSDEKFGSWLFGIARQTCAQFSRKLRPTETLPDGESPEELQHDSPTPSQELQHQEDESEFLQHLGELATEHREVLVLHYLDEFPLAEIAEITGVPLGTVKSRLHYAKSCLRRKCLTRKELAP